MKRLIFLMDSALIMLASMGALFLRENFSPAADTIERFIPYLVATFAATLLALPLSGLNRPLWRFSSLQDHLRLAGAAALTIGVACGLCFVYNRLDGLARSLPFLQFLTIMALLAGARAVHRFAHDARQRRRTIAAKLLRPVPSQSGAKTVLVVGISRLAETYLQAVSELAPGQVRIAGLVGGSERHAARLLAGHRILGGADDLGEILDRLEVHGVTVDRIVVAAPFPSLSAKAREALISAERSRLIEIRFLSEDLGLGSEEREPKTERWSPEVSSIQPALHFHISEEELKQLEARSYWTVKRAIDVFGSLIALVLASPAMLLTAAVVAVSLGDPVLFWQQRPGLGGRPFFLYKFRTMRGAHTRSGRKLSDEERTSSAGSVLRRLRLDELPQLFSILLGDMSFIGPRPLLPKDQSEGSRARLLIRPGLTGWAQVVGGRTISPVDKAALDIWYVQNASLALDLKIVLKTIPIVLLGERISNALIQHAWRDLQKGGVLREGLASEVRKDLQIASSHI
jgi:lipopolysaccharide/colanic/teichoic acid biosynthesis glycosyltransferase